MELPDFHKASFSLSHENPFRLTPPKEQAEGTGFNNASARDHENAKRASSSHDNEYPNPKFSELFESIKYAVDQRKAQSIAFFDLANSEVMLIKKSICITVFSCLAAFAVGTVCWLLLNFFIGSILYEIGLSLSLTGASLLVLNFATALSLFKFARSAYQYVSLHRIIRLIERAL